MSDTTNPRNRLSYSPIGVIRTPFTDLAGMPIQPAGARGVRGTVEVSESYGEGLADLDAFSRIILIYAFHECTTCKLTVTPFLDTTPRGVFATRAPCRPNPIGISIVRLTGRAGTVLTVEDIDVLDGTPLLDIKPYVPAFDAYTDSRCGWLEKNAGGVKEMRSDDRFLNR